MKKKIEYSEIPVESKKPQFNFYKNILDVKLYREPDSQHILIGFDLISEKILNSSKLPLNLQHHIKEAPTSDGKIVKKSWENATEEEKILVSSNHVSDLVVDLKSQLSFPKNSIYYRLPTNPITALNWLGAFVLYLNQDAENFCIHFKNYSHDVNEESFYQGVTEVESIQNYQRENDVNSTIHKVLIEAILSLKNDNSPDCYTNTMQAIQTIYLKYCEDRANEIVIGFVAYSNSLAYLQIQSQLATKELLTPVMGKRAHDGGVYKWSYTEIDFLLSASFSMTPDGKLSIIELDKNPSYKKNYAEGMRNEGIFESELVFLADTLGLAFEQTNFKENGIIFNVESTEKLRAIATIAEELQKVKRDGYAYNLGAFFQSAKGNKSNLMPNSSEGIYEIKYQSSFPKSLPEETQKKLEKVRSCISMFERKNGFSPERSYVSGKLDLNADEVTFVFFNGLHGAHTNKIDTYNKKAIALLKTFGAKIDKVPDRYSYYSQSHVTIPYQKLENLLESLSLLEDIPEIDRMIAKC